MSRPIGVRFVRAHGVYNAGEVAGFDARRAAELVAAKVAVPHSHQAKAALKRAAERLEADQLRIDLTDAASGD